MRATLLYDGACGPCSAFARLVEAADLRGRIRTRRLEEPDMVERYEPLLGSGYYDAFHLDTGGTLVSGGEAVPELLALLPGGGFWRLLARGPLARAALAWGYGELSRARARSGCARM